MACYGALWGDALTNARVPVGWFRHKGWRPAIRVWDLQHAHDIGAHSSCEGLQEELLFPPFIDNVAQPGESTTSVS